VSLDANQVTHFQLTAELNAGNYRMREEIAYLPDFLLRHLTPSLPDIQSIKLLVLKLYSRSLHKSIRGHRFDISFSGTYN
jgi:hypothetical protein